MVLMSLGSTTFSWMEPLSSSFSKNGDSRANSNILFYFFLFFANCFVGAISYCSQET